MAGKESKTDFFKRHFYKQSLSITIDDADKIYLTVGKGLTMKWLFSSPSCSLGESTVYFTGPLKDRQLDDLYQATVFLDEIGQKMHII